MWVRVAGQIVRRIPKSCTWYENPRHVMWSVCAHFKKNEMYLTSCNKCTQTIDDNLHYELTFEIKPNGD